MPKHLALSFLGLSVLTAGCTSDKTAAHQALAVLERSQGPATPGPAANAPMPAGPSSAALPAEPLAEMTLAEPAVPAPRQAIAAWKSPADEVRPQRLLGFPDLAAPSFRDSLPAPLAANPPPQELPPATEVQILPEMEITDCPNQGSTPPQVCGTDSLPAGPATDGTTGIANGAAQPSAGAPVPVVDAQPTQASPPRAELAWDPSLPPLAVLPVPGSPAPPTSDELALALPDPLPSPAELRPSGIHVEQGMALQFGGTYPLPPEFGASGILSVFQQP